MALSVLEVKDIKKSFGKTEVLKDISFSMEKGEVVSIIGSSGSGKTTAMRNLDPKTTFYIDCDKKGLNYKGWKNDFNEEKKNCFGQWC